MEQFERLKNFGFEADYFINHPTRGRVPTFSLEWALSKFPQKGELVKHLEEVSIFEDDTLKSLKTLSVDKVIIKNYFSNYIFKEIPNREFNTCYFEQVFENNHQKLLVNTRKFLFSFYKKYGAIENLPTEIDWHVLDNLPDSEYDSITFTWVDKTGLDLTILSIDVQGKVNLVFLDDTLKCHELGTVDNLIIKNKIIKKLNKLKNCRKGRKIVYEELFNSYKDLSSIVLEE